MLKILSIVINVCIIYTEYGDKMISYEPLWQTMEKKKITTYTLIKYHNISVNTIYRLKHGMGISTLLLDDLCMILDCRVEDILLFVPGNKKAD